MGDDNKLSEEEFRRKLYKWLEDQGLLSELRTHLRQQMIAALRGTTLGAHTANISQTASPKIQSLNLLVAEFLLSHEYHYTLSVFTSEVPLLRTLPQFFKIFKSINRGEIPPIEQTKKNGNYPQLQEQEVWDILETLRLPPDCNAGSYVFHRYQQKLNEPLLTSIICSIPKVIQKWGINELLNTKSHGNSSQRDNLVASGDCSIVDKSTKHCVSETFSDELQKTLLKLHLKPKNFKRIEDDLKSMLQTELERLQKEERDHFQRELIDREERIQKALAQREEVFHQSLKRAEQQLEKQRQTLMMKFQEREAHIIDLAKNMENKCTGEKSKEKLEEPKTDEVKENVASDDQSESSAANSSNVEETNAQPRQQVEDKELKKIHKAASAQWKLSGTSSHDFNAVTKESQTVQFDFTEYQALLEESFVKQETLTKQLEVYQAQQMLMQDMLHRLQQENCNLRQEIFQQRSEINELNTRASELSAELQNARPSISSTLPSHIPVPPPLPPRSIPPSRELASGEEIRYHTSPVATQTLPKSNRDWRRRHRRITLPSSSDETSPTEEILRDARLRLRQLEEESEAVDRSYREFRMRQSVNPYSSIRSVLFQTHRPFQTQNFVNPTASSMVYDFASCNLQASRNGQGPVYDNYKNLNFNFSAQISQPPLNSLNVQKSPCNHPFTPFLHPNINSAHEELSPVPESATPVTSNCLSKENTQVSFPPDTNQSQEVQHGLYNTLPHQPSVSNECNSQNLPATVTLSLNEVQETCLSNTVYRPLVSASSGSEVRTTNVCNFPLMSCDIASAPREPKLNSPIPNDEIVKKRNSSTSINVSKVSGVSSDRKERPLCIFQIKGVNEGINKQSSIENNLNFDLFIPSQGNISSAEDVGARLEEKLSKIFQDTIDTGVKLQSNMSSVYLSDVILDTNESKENLEESNDEMFIASSIGNRIQEEGKPAQDKHSPNASKLDPLTGANLSNSVEPADLSAESSLRDAKQSASDSSANVSSEQLSAGSEFKKANSDHEIW